MHAVASSAEPVQAAPFAGSRFALRTSATGLPANLLSIHENN